MRFTFSLIAGAAGTLLLEAAKLPFWQAIPGIALLVLCGILHERF